MFRSPCGRQRESPIWKHFVYDAATNKSRCTVSLSGPDAAKGECGRLLAGKNPTNLKVHLRTFHAAVFTEMETVSKSPSTSKSTRPAPGTSASTAITHKRMEQFIVKPQTATEIARHNELLLNMFIGTGISTRVMDHPDFRASYCGMLLPGNYASSFDVLSSAVSLHHHHHNF